MGKSEKPALIVFVKNMILGRVKTRLAKATGDQKALEIYRSMVTRIAQLTWSFEGSLYPYFSEYVEQTDMWRPEDTFFKIQKGRNIGQRMNNALKEILQIHHKVVLVGTDIPTLHMDIIHSAFKELDLAEVVLGPTMDGGYYMIGAGRPVDRLFEDIPWSTDQVLVKTIRRADQQGLKYALVKELPDVDYLSDWKKWGWSLDEG